MTQNNMTKTINEILSKLDFSNLNNTANTASEEKISEYNQHTIYNVDKNINHHPTTDCNNNINCNEMMSEKIISDINNNVNHNNICSKQITSESQFNKQQSSVPCFDNTDFHSKKFDKIIPNHNQIGSNDSHQTQQFFNDTPIDESQLHFNSIKSHQLDITKIRKDFPILSKKINNKPLIWFDNAATAHKPQQVIDAIVKYYSTHNSNVHRGVHTLSQEASELFDQARDVVAKFINAESDKNIIFTKGATEGFNLIAETIGKQHIQANDEILITQLEHHSNILPWKKLAESRNAVLKIVPINKNGDISLDNFTSMLSSKTKLVSFCHVANSIGTLVPIQQMIQQAKMFGAITIVDGAQSIPHVPVDVQAIGCDFFVFSGHKMFAPTGTGVVYGKANLIENSIPYQVGGGMIKDVTYHQVKYSPSPYTYEAGTSNLAGIEGLKAAIQYLENLDMNLIAEYEHEIADYAYNQLSQLSHIKIIGKPTQRVSVVSFVVDDMDNNEVGKILDKHGIAVRTGHHCAQPTIRSFGLEGTVRSSFAFYNTHEEVDYMIEVLKTLATK